MKRMSKAMLEELSHLFFLEATKFKKSYSEKVYLQRVALHLTREAKRR